MKYVAEGIRCNGKKEMIVDAPICRELKYCWDVLKVDIVDFLNGSFCKSVINLQSIYSVRGYSKVVDINKISYKNTLAKQYLEIGAVLNVQMGTEKTKQKYQLISVPVEDVDVAEMDTLLLIVADLESIFGNKRLSSLSMSWSDDYTNKNKKYIYLPSIDVTKNANTVNIVFDSYSRELLKNRSISGIYPDTDLCDRLVMNCFSVVKALYDKAYFDEISVLKYDLDLKRLTISCGESEDCIVIFNKIPDYVLQYLNILVTDLEVYLGVEVGFINIDLRLDFNAIKVSKVNNKVSVKVVKV